MELWTGAFIVAIPISIALGRLFAKSLQPECKTCGVKDFPATIDGKKACRSCGTPFPEDD